MMTSLLVRQDFNFSKNHVNCLLQQIFWKLFYNMIAPCPQIQGFQMLTQDNACCSRAIVQRKMKGEPVVCTATRTNNSQIGFLVKEVVADDKSGTISSLFMSRLRVEVDLNDIALSYHTSSPTGLPQSTSSEV